MITVTIFRNKPDKTALTLGVEIVGHAGYAEAGSDIVCSAVSVLFINTCNSIEKFTKSNAEVICEESKDGYLRLYIENPSDKAELLLKSLELGLNSVSEEYGDFVNVVYKIV